MKFEKIDGQQFIILEDSDKICLTTAGELGENSITITETNDKIDFSGNSELVNSIRGEGMIEKVYIPPIISSEDIISKCDKWIEMFKQVHDVFKELVLSEKYRKQNIVMNLSFPKYLEGNSINLDLMHHNDIIQEGVKISIDETNADVYAYLMANVLDYYVKQNYSGSQINNLDIKWNGILYSNIETRSEVNYPMISNLSNLYEISDYARIVKILLTNHNLDIPTAQIISNLRNRINSQQLSERIDETIDYSSRQYEYIVTKPEKEKQAILSKKGI